MAGTRIIDGITAGLLGGLAMDMLWYARHRADGGTSSFREFEFGGDPDDVDEAGPPAQLAAMVAESVGTQVPDERADLASNAVHWATAVGYGLLGAAAPGPRSVPGRGTVIGLGSFAASYAVLGALGLYDPIWEYDRETLAQDATAHLVYGLAAAGALALLDGRRGGA
ncbi:hypothetical protein [Salsipaludibacter albus]|uniref:hypothetical protein n=1 Tax=Salsipaludibacter albus TaxID=2849650 RepID=UPI001EE3DB82|nr:hypothetical protein [Salsipaludibacter albus]MBY5161346.1 hypothetical protein [Salsipaludibacter albus]